MGGWDRPGLFQFRDPAEKGIVITLYWRLYSFSLCICSFISARDFKSPGDKPAVAHSSSRLLKKPRARPSATIRRAVAKSTPGKGGPMGRPGRGKLRPYVSNWDTTPASRPFVILLSQGDNEGVAWRQTVAAMCCI